ncbi:hypothetical protein BBJ29_005731 [Phytophthora kernoviae]|uniref:Uncharacterized protein n=1 Tax=Phytophthora kernoviae TaxID=325452 RepID=A0A3F2RLP2_9STRA|nr:hypothetical protein BBJ29_005731 [Phytophthora kernoviae]RLN59979.1 hypothetical protein BBP00_00006221 [Phytophthora kernoviae]
MVPDKERKRSYRMSVGQQRSRTEHEYYESRALNLTLDINDLRQQVMHLLECRDLQITRLLLTRQHVEGGVLSVVDDILFGRRNQGRSAASRDEGCSFSRMFMAQSDAAPSTGGVFEFTLQLDKPNFNHQSCTIATTQVLSFVEEDEDGDTKDTAEVRVICGGAGGCLVEAVGEFKGRFTRDILSSMFPHVLSNEMVAQADVFAAFAALQQARPTEFAALMGQA